MGDEEGLLIIVEHNRPWYPDSRHPAQPIAFAVTLANGRVLTLEAKSLLEKVNQ